MMIQGKSCGYTVPSAANMRGTTSGTLDTNPSGYTEVSPNQPFLVMTAPAEGMYIRSFPKTGKETDTGKRAKTGEIYERIKTVVPSKFKDFNDFFVVDKYADGEIQYMWSLIKDPAKPDTEALGWVVALEAIRLGNKLEKINNTLVADSESVAKSTKKEDLEATVKENEATYAKWDEWKKKQKPAETKTTTPTPAPSTGMSTGLKVGLALGAAALVYFVVAKSGKKG